MLLGAIVRVLRFAALACGIARRDFKFAANALLLRGIIIVASS